LPRVGGALSARSTQYEGRSARCQRGELAVSRWDMGRTGAALEEDEPKFRQLEPDGHLAAPTGPHSPRRI